MSGMGSAGYATVGDSQDVRNMAAGAMFARLVLVPHERMKGTGQYAAHVQGGHWSGCKGSWRVIVVAGGQPHSMWRCPTQASGERVIRELTRWIAAGIYPVDLTAPSSVHLGHLEVLQDDDGRLRLPGGKVKASKAPKLKVL